MPDKDWFPLLVRGYRFDCFLQQGHFPEGVWEQSDNGDKWVAVCKCGWGAYGDSLDDAVENLKKSYFLLRDERHWHYLGAAHFNVIRGTDEDV